MFLFFFEEIQYSNCFTIGTYIHIPASQELFTFMLLSIAGSQKTGDRWCHKIFHRARC